jgi:hypothetical protein
LYHPYQVAFLDAQGRPVREFWHPGHLQAMTLQDIDGDGHKELLLGGVNNEVRQATLVALDPARADGAARVHNPAYQFRGLPFAQEKARLYFPRTPVGKGDAFNTVVRLDVSGGRLTVHVDEAPRGTQPTTLFYHLSGELAVREVGFSDTFSLRAKELGVDLEAERKRLRSVSRE